MGCFGEEGRLKRWIQQGCGGFEVAGPLREKSQQMARQNGIRLFLQSGFACRLNFGKLAAFEDTLDCLARMHKWELCGANQSRERKISGSPLLGSPLIPSQTAFW